MATKRDSGRDSSARTKGKQGFASMSKDKVREIAAEGGRTSRGGGFKNNPELASIAGRKGGKMSRGGGRKRKNSL